ncbi:hypothetical protein E2562_017622 [Oryza meyeriana var. granulata]|uniref:Uncharacterized protein n=1 Tax=Oryza meyeriana var. granulata TaxID=110450 RepID=A0A6G1BXN9_9ORYZ|nr:hypothetical protein E2562_017622 [Oryza meyeriana var. granulata]
MSLPRACMYAGGRKRPAPKGIVYAKPKYGYHPTQVPEEQEGMMSHDWEQFADPDTHPGSLPSPLIPVIP